MSELSQGQLEELVIGKPARPNVVFYDVAVLDVLASKEQNRRIYQTQTYIKACYPGVTDWVPRLAKKADIEKYPEEYRHYMGTRQGSNEPLINVLPGLNLAHLQELTDYGLVTLRQLVAVDTLPPHLEPAKQMAQRLLAAIDGEKPHAPEIENRHDQRDAYPENRGQVAPPPGGQHDRDPVQGQLAGAGPGDRGGEAREGIHPHRREHGDYAQEEAREIQRSREAESTRQSYRYEVDPNFSLTVS